MLKEFRIGRMLASDDVSSRSKGREALEEHVKALSSKFLLKLLQDSHRSVVSCAMNELVRRKDERAVEPIVTILQREDVTMGVRIDAARSLGASGDARAVQPLIEAMSGRGKANLDLQFVAIDALGEIGKLAVEPLVRLVEQNAEPKTVEYAAAALGKIQDDRSIECLNKVLTNYSYQFIVRCYAVQALTRIGDKRSQEPILKAISDNKYDSYFVDALAKLGDSSAIGVLEGALEGMSSHLKTHANDVLSKLKGTTPKWAIPLGAGERDHLKIAQAFIDGELNAQSPDFGSLRTILEKFDNGQKNGSWLNVGYAFKTKKRDEWTAAQCFVEGLGYYPKPLVVNWEHIVIPSEAPDSKELQAQARAAYKEEASQATRLETLGKLRGLFGAPGSRQASFAASS
jgi:HEAT repeat protein